MFTKKHADRILIRLQKLTYETLESLSDVELRDAKKEYLDKIIDSCKEMMSRFKDDKQVATISEMFQSLLKKQNKLNNQENEPESKDESKQSIYSVSKSMIGTGEELDEAVSILLKNGDITWVLCIFNINGLGALNNSDSGNHNKGDSAIKMLQTYIKDKCQQNRQRFLAFKEDRTGSCDQFALLIQCIKSVDFVQRQVELIFNKIDSAEYSVSVGITGVFKRTKYTTANEIIKSGIDSLNDAKKQVKSQIATKNNGVTDHKGKCNFEWNKWDKKIFTLNLNAGTNVLLQKQAKNASVPKKDKYIAKRNEIANTRDTNWVLAAMDGDKFGKISHESMIGASYVIALLNNEIFKICQKYNDKCQCIGYQRGGDEFSMFIYCPNGNKNVAAGVVEELFKNIRAIGEFTVSACLTFLDDDETGEEWEIRAEIALKKAKNDGRDRLYWQKSN